MSKRAKAPSKNPKQTTSKESQEIVRSTQTFNQLYPGIKSADDLKSMSYLDLKKKIEEEPSKSPKNAKDFYKVIQEVEKALQKVAVSQFSYEKAKSFASKSPREKTLFTQLERQAGNLQTALKVGVPKYDTLFSALTFAEFESNMSNPNIIHPVIANDPIFKARAKKVYEYILSYRRKNKSELQKDTIDQYLNTIYKAKKDELQDAISGSEASKIIHASIVQRDPELLQKLAVGHSAYLKYREYLEKRINTIGYFQNQTETYIDGPVQQARKIETGLAKGFEKLKENYEKLSSGERAGAIIAVLAAAAWFLNTNNEEASKLRDIFKKAGMVGLGYLAVNTISKAATGKYAKEWVSKWSRKKSGKNELLEQGFNASKDEAETMQKGIAYMGDQDFHKLGKIYMQQKMHYDEIGTPLKNRILPYATLDQEVSPEERYLTMHCIDKGLKANNSSMADLLNSIDEAEAEAKRKGKKFVRPNLVTIATAILLNKDLAYKFTKDGKVEMVFARDVETKWDKKDKNSTLKWWMVTGSPADWRKQAFDFDNKYPKEDVRSGHLDRLSSKIMPNDKPLSNFITQDNFGRYTPDFIHLYEHRISKKVTQPIHQWTNSRSNIMAMSSRVSLDAAAYTGSEQAKVTAVKNAYEQALKVLKKDPKYASIKDRLHEFVHPVHGTFIAPSRTFNFGSRKFTTGKNKPLDYVMFLRFALPGSVEHKLRKDKEWAEGDMIEQLQGRPMKGNERLTRADFISLATTNKGQKSLFRGRVKVGENTRPFGGAYESFLNNFGLKRSQTDLIDNVLDYYSVKFIRTGVSKSGLVRYLASHKFTEAEKREALKKSKGALPIIKYKFNIVDKIRVRTYAVVDAQNAISKFKNKKLLQNRLTANLGMAVVQACYGDLKALSTIKGIDETLYLSIIKAFKMNVNTGKIGNTNITSANFDKIVLESYQKVLLNYLTDTAKAKKADSEISTYQTK